MSATVASRTSRLPEYAGLSDRGFDDFDGVVAGIASAHVRVRRSIDIFGRIKMAVSITTLNDRFAVAPQLSPDDMAEVAAAGYKSVIINRPDFEGGPDQPSSTDVMAAARAAGLKAEYLPVISGAASAQDVLHFAELLKQLPAPVLAFCRTGTRSASLYHEATGL
jgi:uncharacterized protein (TIGR01244 family)